MSALIIGESLPAHRLGGRGSSTRGRPREPRRASYFGLLNTWGCLGVSGRRGGLRKHVGRGDVMDAAVAEGEEGRVNATPEDVEDGLDAGLAAHGEAPEVGAADKDRASGQAQLV